MELHGDEWGRKGATLSDKTARAEFGLTQDEIIAAIRAGKLQYRPAAMHGNPWLRLLRRAQAETRGKPKSGPFPLLTLRAGVTAQELRHALDDRQSQAGPTIPPSGRPIGLGEGPEQPLQHVLTNADSGVLYRNFG